MAQADAALKEEARGFLVRTQEEMTAPLPETVELRKIVREAAAAKQGLLSIGADARTAFLYTFFIPRFFALVQTIGDIRERGST